MAVIVVDGDILPYEVGFAMDDGADWPLVRKAIQEKFARIMERGAHFVGEEIEDVEVYLSDPEGTFRKFVATILPYKGNRDPYKPYHWDGIRAYLRDHYGATSHTLLEGDDAVLIRKKELENQGKQVLVASSDKDLRQVPIKLYRWETGSRREEFYEVAHEVQGYRNFWAQMLTGDRTDNVMGLFGLGKKAAAVTKLHSMLDPIEMARSVFTEYERRFGSYARKFFEENFQLLRLIDDPVYWDINDPYAYMEMMIEGMWAKLDLEDESETARGDDGEATD